MIRYTVIIEKAIDGGDDAYVPDLPGCIGMGATKEEVLENIAEAIELHIEGMKAEGLPVPTTGYRGRKSYNPCLTVKSGKNSQKPAYPDARRTTICKIHIINKSIIRSSWEPFIHDQTNPLFRQSSLSQNQ